MNKRTGYAMLCSSVALVALSAGSALAQDDNKYYQAAVEEAARIAEGMDLSGYVEFIGQNSGVEGQTLQDVYAAFTEGSGVEVRYTGTPDTVAIIQSRVQAGNPPDVGELQLGNALQYASSGALVDLSEYFGEELTANFNEMLLSTATYEDQMIGIYQGMNPFMVWYNPQTYGGPQNPEDWQALVDYTKAQAEEGNTVWCAAQGAGASTGFPGAQMLEAVFLKMHGPELYAQWGSGELSWTSDEVKAAFEEFGSTIVGEGKVDGGVMGAITNSIATGYNGLVSDPATCELALWGAWVPGLLGEAAVPGETIDFFRVPASNPDYYGYEFFQSAISLGFTDRPETLAFLEFMQSTPAQTYLASLNRWPVANQNVPADTYPSEVLQDVATEFFSGETDWVAGPNSLNTGATATAMYSAIVNYMRDPDSLDEILAEVDATVE